MPALAVMDALAAATASADSEDVSQDLADLQRRGLLLALDDETVILNAMTGVEKVLTPLAWKLIGFGALQTVRDKRRGQADAATNRHGAASSAPKPR
jgi:hypothetical protein